MERKPQSYSNHAKLAEPYHFFISPVACIAMVLGIFRAVRKPDFDTVALALIGVAFFLAVYRLRTYPLKVQDRLIRLEERMRLAQLLPERDRGRIAELTESQLVALRFASDAELPALFERALSGRLTNKQIKQSIQVWRPDYFRV
jgi:hypothetical protein